MNGAVLEQKRPAEQATPETGTVRRKKEPLTHRSWAKAVAWLLLLASAAAFYLAAVGILESWRMDLHRYSYLSDLKKQQFSVLCRELASDAAAAALLGEDVSTVSQGVNAVFLAVLPGEDGSLTEGDAARFEEVCAYSPFVYGYLFAARTPAPVGATVSAGALDPDGGLHVSYLRDVPVGQAAPEAGQAAVYAAVDIQSSYRDQFYEASRRMDLLWQLGYGLDTVAGVSALLALACFVFLLWSAGLRPGGEEPAPGRFTGIPFDLLTVGALLMFGLLLGGGMELAMELDGLRSEPFRTEVFYISFLPPVLGCVLIFTLWCTSIALRLRLKTLWSNTLLARLCGIFRRSGQGIRRGLAGLFRGLWGILRTIPLLWKTLLLLGLWSVLCIAVPMRLRWDTDMLAVWLLLERLAEAGFVFYVAFTLRRLQAGGAALAAGNLKHHTDTRGMLWDFKKHGEDLNSISAGMTRAVEERLRSERLKTELITNVSHDLKTPLTSLINYVDLLKKNTDPEKTGEYLEVLDRQSRRLKKLTEDLMEVSKASTGNLELHPRRNSVNELLRQAAGEYSERLETAGLEPVLTLPETELFVYADGALLWRVTDNLISNACKYSQPGTRFYMEAAAEGELVRLSFKNISRDRLSKSPEELMERFVRGDSARSGEGSGLGLNIARSLTELQGGELRILLDGDLFKAEVLLPVS